MARPARPERSRSARSSRQLSRFYHSINPDRVFGTHSVQIRDGLIAIYYGRKARVRILDERSTITLKGEHKGLGRSEFEYAIPFPDAEEMLRTMCDGRVLEKIRYYVPHAELTWEINVYDGILKGVGCGRTSLDTTVPLNRSQQRSPWFFGSACDHHTCRLSPTCTTFSLQSSEILPVRTEALVPVNRIGTHSHRS
jgi:CYTH domain-containing protein